MRQKLRRRIMIAIWALLGLAAVWFAADLAYSLAIDYRVRRWEGTIARDPAGVREGCREYTLGDGDAAVLLIHGINDSPAAYQKMAPVLTEAGFTCRAMRLPGFAEPLQNYAKTTRRDWLASVAAEIEGLKRRHRHVDVVAHSLGGAVAIEYLCDHPQAVRKAVLIAPAIAVSDRRSPLLGTRTWHAIARRMLVFSKTTESTFPIDAHGLGDTQYPWRYPFTPLGVVDETFALIDDNRTRAPQLRTPLLMVLSRDDRVIDSEAAERFFQAAASSEKELFFVPDSGHAITVDNDWQAVTTKIVEFLGDARKSPPDGGE